MKPRECRTIAQQMIGQKLESYRLAQLQVVRAIDLAHATFTLEANDSISIDKDCSRNKTRVIDRVERLGLA